MICRLALSTLEEVDQPAFSGNAAEVGLVQPVALHYEDRQHITPLTVGDHSAASKPVELLKQNVFG